MPASTSGAPLVPRRRRRGGKASWYQRNISKPLSKLNPWNWIGKKKRPAVHRSIFINEPIPEDYFDKKHRPLKDKQFASNQNITSKYTVITFLPRNLLEQFRRVANIFFLGIAILQFFPKFSTISPGLVILPLIVVLAITALKDGYEDVKRHQADHKINNSVVHILGGPGYENLNPTEGKTKTFIKGVPLPRRFRKKTKHDHTAPVPTRTDSIPDDHGIRRTRSQVSNWDLDPEAGDSPDELGWQRAAWEDVKVGDFVKIYDHEPVPAGKLLLLWLVVGPMDFGPSRLYRRPGGPVAACFSVSLTPW
jgi:phospholipid-translocating ATPase